MSLDPLLPLVQSLELDPLLPLKTDMWVDAELEKVALCTALARCTSAAMQVWGDDPPKGRNPQEMRQYLNEELTRAATREAAPEGQQREAAPVATVIVPDAEPAEKRVKEEESATERIVVDDEYGEVEIVGHDDVIYLGGSWS